MLALVARLLTLVPLSLSLLSTGPRGPTGETGPTGPKGEQGEAGPTVGVARRCCSAVGTLACCS